MLVSSTILSDIPGGDILIPYCADSLSARNSYWRVEVSGERPAWTSQPVGGNFNSLVGVFWFSIVPIHRQHRILLGELKSVGSDQPGISPSLSGEIWILYSADSVSPRHSDWGAEVCREWPAWAYPHYWGEGFQFSILSIQCNHGILTGELKSVGSKQPGMTKRSFKLPSLSTFMGPATILHSQCTMQHSLHRRISDQSGGCGRTEGGRLTTQPYNRNTNFKMLYKAIQKKPGH